MRRNAKENSKWPAAAPLQSFWEPSPTIPRSSPSGKVSANTSDRLACRSMSCCSPIMNGKSNRCWPTGSTSPGTRRWRTCAVKEHTGGRSRSLGMRNSDRDFHSRILVRTDSGIARLADLEGKRLAVGSRDSTQARILPLYFLKQQGVDLDRMHIVPFDSGVGKHGDTGVSELDVLAALRNGAADAGAVGDSVWLAEQSAGRVDPRLIESLWTTPGFDHCMFDALPDLDSKKVADFQAALFSMRWDNPAHRRLLELEGLKQWLPPRKEGYKSLRLARRPAVIRDD